MLIVGKDGGPADRDGAPTRVMAQVQHLRTLGYPIQFLLRGKIFAMVGVPTQTKLLTNI